MKGVRVLGVVVLVAAATACEAPVESFPQPPASDAPAYPDSGIEASRSSADAPESFRGRDPLPSCGDVLLEQGEWELPAEAAECLGSGGELAVQFWTVEGDAIVRYYRTGRGIAGVEVYEDSTWDRFGSMTWTYRTFPDAAVAGTDLADC